MVQTGFGRFQREEISDEETTARVNRALEKWA